MQIKLDTVSDSDFQRQGTYQTATRGGVVTGITDEDVASSADYFFVVDQAIRNYTAAVTTDGKHPSRSDFFYQGVQILGTSGRTVRFKMFFATFSSAVASVYTIRDRSFQAAYEGNLTPGTRKPIIIGMDNSNPKLKLKPRLGTMRFNRTMRALSVTKLIYGNGEADRMNAKDWVNTTNDVAFQGLPAFYWYCAEYSVDISRYSGYFIRTITAIAKTDEDVSEFEFLKSSITDKHAVDMATVTANVASILDLTYKHGIINDGTGSADLASTKCGIARVGPYKPATFNTLFGFSTTAGLIIS